MSENPSLYLAIRVRKQINVLIAMESDCNCNCNEIVERIKKFYKEHPLQERIIKWVTFLYKTNQRIYHWDIDWALMTEIEDETRQKFPNYTQEELLAIQEIMDIREKSAELERYRSMYPTPFV